jgi:hypothetical protein
MQHLVSRHRFGLGLQFLALEAFVSEMGAAIPGIVKRARRDVDAEGSELGLTAARIDQMLAATFPNRLGYAAIVASQRGTSDRLGDATSSVREEAGIPRHVVGVGERATGESQAIVGTRAVRSSDAWHGARD